MLINNLLHMALDSDLVLIAGLAVTSGRGVIWCIMGRSHELLLVCYNFGTLNAKLCILFISCIDICIKKRAKIQIWIWISDFGRWMDVQIPGADDSTG